MSDSPPRPCPCSSSPPSARGSPPPMPWPHHRGGLAADRLGYTRLWVAEHHNMPAVASTNLPVLIAHLAAVTERTGARFGRRDAAQPRAARRRRAVRAAGGAAPPASTWGSPRAGHRPADRPRAAPRPRGALRRGLLQLLDLLGLLGDQRVEGGLAERSSATPARSRRRMSCCSGPAVSPRSWLGPRLPFAYAHHRRVGTLAAVQLYRDSFRPSASLEPAVHDRHRRRPDRGDRRRGAAPRPARPAHAAVHPDEPAPAGAESGRGGGRSGARRARAMPSNGDRRRPRHGRGRDARTARRPPAPTSSCCRRPRMASRSGSAAWNSSPKPGACRPRPLRRSTWRSRASGGLRPAQLATAAVHHRRFLHGGSGGCGTAQVTDDGLAAVSGRGGGSGAAGCGTAARRPARAARPAPRRAPGRAACRTRPVRRRRRPLRHHPVDDAGPPQVGGPHALRLRHLTGPVGRPVHDRARALRRQRADQPLAAASTRSAGTRANAPPPVPCPSRTASVGAFSITRSCRQRAIHRPSRPPRPPATAPPRGCR